jgi:hypothetical protein
MIRRLSPGFMVSCSLTTGAWDKSRVPHWLRRGEFRSNKRPGVRSGTLAVLFPSAVATVVQGTFIDAKREYSRTMDASLCVRDFDVGTQ